MTNDNFAVNPVDTNAADHEPVVETRKPDNTAFKQQRLPAWQPVLSPKSVLPLFFTVGFLFIALGISFYVASEGVIEHEIDYTHCTNLANVPCHTLNVSATCECIKTLNVTEDMASPVFIYYGLSNFYQNHRRYVKSRDDKQLAGEDIDVSSISNDCEPYKLDANGKPIAPCGAIANSLFNDTFSVSGTTSGSILTIDRTNIAWTSDHAIKFNNPGPTNDLEKAFANFGKPFNWNINIWELDNTTKDNSNNGYKNEALEVWMRPAAFPTFRKLYGRVGGTNGLSVGEYTIKIDYNYPVVNFEGTKKIVFSTISWLGGKNSFLGLAYIIVGSISFLTGLILILLSTFNPPTPM